METSAKNLLAKAGIKPTSNRILVLRELMHSPNPLSLIELDTRLGTLDKSSILRVLNLLTASHLLHCMEDGRGIEKYELCLSPHAENPFEHTDMHPHFYCEKCGKVVCLSDLQIPQVEVPEGYEVHSVNYMLKGVCPDCKE